MPGTWPLPGPRPKRFRWCSVRPRRRWKAGIGRSRASTRWSRCRGGCSIARCRRWARSISAVSMPPARCRTAPSAGRCTRPSRRRCDDGGQVILLLNRRGFSTHIQCPACGHVVRCPQCDIALTHHRTEAIALCHYCDYQTPAPSGLPGLRFRRHSLFGPGHAAARGRGPGPLPERSGPADGHRHDAGTRQPRSGRWRPSARARSASCWARR